MPRRVRRSGRHRDRPRPSHRWHGLLVGPSGPSISTVSASRSASSSAESCPELVDGGDDDRCGGHLGSRRTDRVGGRRRRQGERLERTGDSLHARQNPSSLSSPGTPESGSPPRSRTGRPCSSPVRFMGPSLRRSDRHVRRGRRRAGDVSTAGRGRVGGGRPRTSSPLEQPATSDAEPATTTTNKPASTLR